MHNPETHNTSSNLKSLWHFIVPPAMLCFLVFFLWPYLQYYIDPDAISYLNIAERYIAGDYQHAINAFWSPMGCWLTAVLVKASGWPLFASAIMVNTIPALGMVIAGQALFHRFRQDNWERWCFGLMSACFWSYTVYFQSFTDIWQFFFLTIGLLILLKRNFIQNPLWWIIIGIIAALAYFGKAYSFYFFPLMILIVTAMKLKAEGQFHIKKLILICFVAVAAMMLTAGPWLFLIHEKYGIWTSSTAGKLNMSWWLVGTQEFKEGITVLVPPPYQGSLFYFEDPYLAQGRMVHFWDSPGLFIRQIARTGYNFIGWVTSANRISAFYFGIWIISILFFLRKNNGIFNTLPEKILLVVFLIFPLPYWLLTFDGGRYLWFTIPLCSILALRFTDVMLFPYLSHRFRKIFVAVFFLSFLVTPVSDMKGMYKTGEAEFETAQQLEKLGIKGSFVSNLSYADAAAELIRISWFSKNSWYCHTLNNFTTAEILKDATRYGVKYYFYFYNGATDDYELKNADGQPLPDLTHGTIKGLKVYQLSR